VKDYNKEIVSVIVEGDIAKYVNFRQEVLLEVPLQFAQELQTYYQRNYVIRDEVVMENLSKVADTTCRKERHWMIGEAVRILSRTYEDKHE
jgi:hypothetical protein|tara:strand:+ start:802 stop:1074 length:273 start_codon:yes stop_codon:yes gene_type:complete